MRSLIVLIALAAAACGSLRELSPETAASRISSSDGYKAEACAMAQRYAQHLGEYRWSDALPDVPLDANELAHMTAVFAQRPEISCRLKVDKYMYDFGNKDLYELTAAVAAMETAYASLPPGGSLADCEACALPDYSPSGPLTSYYKAPAFADARRRHAANFAALCLDVENLNARAAAVNAHAAHHEPRFNPLYERHGGCDWVYKTVFASESGSCARFAQNPYVICTQAVWRTDAAPAKPLTYFPQGYRKVDWFGGGFVLALNDGAFDVYWLENGRLNHKLGSPSPPARMVDVDDDGRTDVTLGGFVVLSRPGGGVSTTLTALNASREADERARKVRQFEDTFTRLPLADVEQLLSGEQADNPVLLERAADASHAWWTSAAEEQRATLERVEIYWHAALWNGVMAKHPVDDDYLSQLLAATAPERLAERRSEVSAARRAGDGARLFEACGALRQDAAGRVAELEAALTGTETAEAALGALWQRYRGSPLPKAQVIAALEAAKRNQAELETFLNTVCL